MESAIIQNLKQQIERQKLSVPELAKQADVRASFIYDILHGKSANPSTTRLARIAETLGVSLQELLGIEERSFRPIPANSVYVAVSSILVAASAGDGNFELEEREGEPYYFRKSWLRERLQANAEDLRMVYIEGDSMEPTLCQGDMLLIDLTKTSPSPPGIFVLFDGMGLVAKRLEFIAGSTPPRLRVLTDNPKYSPYEQALDDSEIIGRVVWFAREI